MLRLATLAACVAVPWCAALPAGAEAPTAGNPPPAAAAPAGWTPQAWLDEETLELTTDAPGEGTYTFPVWLVVIDGQVYVRLGGRAAGRVERSQSAPLVGVTVHGQRFERVRAEPAPDMAPRVAAAIADKYWSDLFIHFLPHPLTARLVPQ